MAAPYSVLEHCTSPEKVFCSEVLMKLQGILTRGTKVLTLHEPAIRVAELVEV